MKLAAIYNVWDDELIEGSIRMICDHVDLIVIVYQDVSNFGEAYSPAERLFRLQVDNHKIFLVKYDPRIEMGGFLNETAKRNMGLDIARQKKCTHFLHMDCDEYYEDFEAMKALYIRSGRDGSACRMRTYFKLPTLMMDPPEDYYVPFIHKLDEDTVAGHPYYQVYVDPTRRINCRNVVIMPQPMHHYSWVRKDIMRKARNSSANINDQLVNNKQIFEDYFSPDLGPGYFLRNWNRTLISAPNIFGIEVN